MRCALLLATLSLAFPARAGLVYDFTTTVNAERTSSRVTGRVWVDGNSYRAELNPDPTRKIDVVISNDADRTAVFLDVDKQTWVDRVRVSNDVRSSSMFLWPMAGAKVGGRPSVIHRVLGQEDVAGQRATVHLIAVRFMVESHFDGTRVRGTIVTTVRLWIAESLPTLPMNREVRTGYPEVDRKLVPICAGLEGMIVRHELEVTRTMDGGPPQKEVTKSVVSGIEVVDVPRDKFEVPSGFAYAGSKAP